MNTFNSFGANYTLKFALSALFAKGSKNSEARLIRLLAKKYKGSVVLTYKCREAIMLALTSSGIDQGNLVAVCKYTCREVTDAIKNSGLTPIYIDLEKGGLNFSAKELKSAFYKYPNIKAVLVQNTLGYPCKIDEITKFCKEKKLFLIEDLAHCAGGKYHNGKEMGSIGDFVTLSFSQNKILDSTAGGALIVRGKTHVNPPQNHPNLRRQLADRIYPICSYCIKNVYFIYLLFERIILLSKGFTSAGIGVHKLASWYCTLTLKKFANLERNISHRRKIAKVYAATIRSQFLFTMLVKDINLSAHFRFPIFLKKEKSLINHLAKNHIYLDDKWYKNPGLTLPTHVNVSKAKAFEISRLINEWSDLGGY